MPTELSFNIVAEENRYANVKFAFIIYATLVCCRFWSFQGLSERVYQVLELSVSIPLLFISITQYSRIKQRFLNFKINVLLFVCLPFVSLFAASIFHDQSIFLSVFILRRILFWLLYYVVHIFKIPIEKLIGLMIFIGLVWAFLTIIQQFTYPNFVFYTRNGEDDQEFLRAGIYRFMIDPFHFGLFFTLYFYYKYLITKNIYFLVYVLFGLTGFYFYATRQFAVAAIVCMIIASITLEGKAKIYPTIVIFLIIATLFFFKDELFGQFIEMTSDQLQSKDDVRVLSAKFFMFNYWPHWTTYFIGNGLDHNSSPYGKEMTRIGLTYGYYRGDIGILGTFNSFGIFYVINVFSMLLIGLRNKFYSTDDKYLKLFFIYALMLIGLTDYSSYPSEIPFFCFIFYLVDKAQENKLIKSIYFLPANSSISTN